MHNPSQPDKHLKVFFWILWAVGTQGIKAVVPSVIRWGGLHKAFSDLLSRLKKKTTNNSIIHLIFHHRRGSKEEVDFLHHGEKPLQEWNAFGHKLYYWVGFPRHLQETEAQCAAAYSQAELPCTSLGQLLVPLLKNSALHCSRSPPPPSPPPKLTVNT